MPDHLPKAQWFSVQCFRSLVEERQREKHRPGWLKCIRTKIRQGLRASRGLGTPKTSKNLKPVGGWFWHREIITAVSGAFCWDTPTIIQITLHNLLLRPIHVCAAEWETALWCPGCLFGALGQCCTATNLVCGQTAKAWACISRLVEQCRTFWFYLNKAWQIIEQYILHM